MMNVPCFVVDEADEEKRKTHCWKLLVAGAERGKTPPTKAVSS